MPSLSYLSLFSPFLSPFVFRPFIPLSLSFILIHSFSHSFSFLHFFPSLLPLLSFSFFLLLSPCLPTSFYHFFPFFIQLFLSLYSKIPFFHLFLFSSFIYFKIPFFIFS